MSILHWIVFVIFLLPPMFVLMSSRVSGHGKWGWALISLFLSWIGFAIFLIAHAGRNAPAKQG